MTIDIFITNSTSLNKSGIKNGQSSVKVKVNVKVIKAPNPICGGKKYFCFFFNKFWLIDMTIDIRVFI